MFFPACYSFSLSADITAVLVLQGHGLAGLFATELFGDLVDSA